MRRALRQRGGSQLPQGGLQGPQVRLRRRPDQHLQAVNML